MTAKEKQEPRKLSISEQKRKLAFDETVQRMKAEGFQTQDMTVSPVRANVLGVLLGLVMAVILVILFFGNTTLTEIIMGVESPMTFLFGLVAFLLVVIALVVVHELVHGITWAILAPSHWKAVSFGFLKEYLTPYCTCNEPLSRGAYIAGALMPLIVLGLLPGIASVVTSSVFLLGVAVLMIIGAGGDMLIVINVLRFRDRAAQEKLWLDHPYRVGSVVFTR